MKYFIAIFGVRHSQDMKDGTSVTETTELQNYRNNFANIW